MAVFDHNFYALNAVRRYPLDEIASAISDDGLPLPNGILVDCSITLPNSYGRLLYLSGINVTENLVTAVFLATDNALRPANAESSSSGGESIIPIAAVTVLRSAFDVFRPYQVKPLQPGVGGWVVFGRGAEVPYTGRFSTPSQSLLLPRCAWHYDPPPVTSLSKLNTEAKLRDIVTLLPGNDIAIELGTRVIDGDEKEAVIIRLDADLADTNVYELYAGPCGARPESRNCPKPPIEILGGAVPDCDGNIQIDFEFVTVGELSSAGITIAHPLGLTDICRGTDYIPDSDGNLPDPFADPPDLLSSSSVPFESSESATAESSISCSVDIEWPFISYFDPPYEVSFALLQGIFLSDGSDILFGDPSAGFTAVDSPQEGVSISGSYALPSPSPSAIYFNAERDGQAILVTGCAPYACNNMRITTDFGIFPLNSPYGPSFDNYQSGGIVFNYRDPTETNPYGGSNNSYYMAYYYYGSDFIGLMRKGAGTSHYHFILQSVGLKMGHWYRLSVEIRPIVGDVEIEVFVDSLTDPDFVAQSATVAHNIWLTSPGLPGPYNQSVGGRVGIANYIGGPTSSLFSWIKVEQL